MSMGQGGENIGGPNDIDRDDRWDSDTASLLEPIISRRNRTVTDTLMSMTWDEPRPFQPPVHVPTPDFNNGQPERADSSAYQALYGFLETRHKIPRILRTRLALFVYGCIVLQLVAYDAMSSTPSQGRPDSHLRIQNAPLFQSVAGTYVADNMMAKCDLGEETTDLPKGVPIPVYGQNGAGEIVVRAYHKGEAVACTVKATRLDMALLSKNLAEADLEALPKVDIDPGQVIQ